VGEKTVQTLVEAGVHGLAHLAEMTDEDLSALEGVGPKTLEKLREAAGLAQAEWDARDAAYEAERLAAEQEQIAAEQAAAEQAAAEQAAEQAAAKQPAAEQPAAAEPDGETQTDRAAETAEAAAGGGAEEGGVDGER
jgi:hypothetical protein